MLVSLTFVLVGLGVLLLRSRDEARRLPLEPSSRQQIESPAHAHDAEQARARDSALSPSAETQLISSEREVDPAAIGPAIPLTGRLLLPPSVPADERAFVALNGTADAELEAFWLDDSDAEDLELDRKPIAADGSFALDMPPGLAQAWIELEARYLVLEEAAVLDDFEHPAPLELPTLLGGVLRLAFVPSPGLVGDPAVLVGREVRLGFWDTSASFGPGGPTSIVANIDSTLAVEFAGLSPRLSYSLEMESSALSPFAPPRAESLHAVPGESTTVELALEDGLVVAGRVLDEAGAGVANAILTAEYGEENKWSSSCSAKSDADGAFRFEALSPLLQSIDIDQPGFLERSIAVLRAARDGGASTPARPRRRSPASFASPTVARSRTRVW
jgi:hypothetical protein